ncbi:hypothetical protein BDB01DRAFT_37859 [Pilobolus umbonatus]|nr:hypothetical protein BDB01DRAFT_37859 [Pilobolus umbonatus]
MGAFSPPTKENNSGLDYMGSVDETDTTKVKKEDEHSSIRRSSRKRKQVNYAEYNEPEKKQKTSNRATPELVYTQHTLQSSSPPSSMEYSDSPNSLDAATELTYRNELELQKSTERVPGEFLLIASPPLPPSAYQSIPNQRVMQSEIQMSLDPHLYNTYPVTQQVDLYPSNAYSIHHPDIHHYSAGHPDIHPYSMDHPPSPYSISQTTNPYSTSQPDNHLTGHPIHQNPMSHPGSPSPHHYSATHPSNPHPVSYPSNPHPLSYPSNPHPVSYPSNPHPVSHPSNHPISHQSTNGNHVYPSNETLFLDDCCPIGNSPDIGRSPDNTLCNKCHRHKMIFGLFWPVRKIKECKPMKPTNPKASHRKRPIPLSKTGKGRVTKNKGSPIKSAVVAPKRVPNMAAVEEGVTELILRHDDAFSMDSFILPEQSEEETHLSWKFQ